MLTEKELTPMPGISKEDQFIIEFAYWLEHESWEYDFREQKTHTYAEKLTIFRHIWEHENK